MASPQVPTPRMKLPPDDYRGHELIITQFVFLGIATALVIARVYVRTRVVRSMGWDDWLIIPALLIAIVGAVFNVYMVRAGFGRHQIYLIRTPLKFIEGMKWQTIWQPTFIISVILTRISICLFLLRIFNVRRLWRLSLYGIILFILITNVPSLIIAFTQCRPYEKSWSSTLPGKCLDPNAGLKIGLYNGIVSILIDWVLATLPIVFLWDMKLSAKSKIGICALMGMGYFSGICAIVRTVEFVRVTRAGKTVDFSWKTIDLRIWGLLENVIGIIAACIPVTKALYTKAKASSYFSWISSRNRTDRSKTLVNSNEPDHLNQHHHGGEPLRKLPKPVQTDVGTYGSGTFGSVNDDADFNPTESRIGMKNFSRSVNKAFGLKRHPGHEQLHDEEMNGRRQEPRSMIHPEERGGHV